ncbi:MAG: lectin-like protein, partial [Polyangiales bacterium]
CTSGRCVAPLSASCAVILRGDPGARDGAYSIAPAGAALEARCDMSTGRGYTFLPGGVVGAEPAAILGACPPGTAAFEVRSEAHAAALRRYVVSPTPRDQLYWANFFTGPSSTCPTLATRGGWLRSAMEWVDGNVPGSALAPLDVGENCNNMGIFDPIVLDDRVGYANHSCSGCRYIYNHTEAMIPGRVVCSVNDVPACAVGTDDCNGLAADGCEVDLRSDAAHCGRCRSACAAGLRCMAGACAAPCDAPRQMCGGVCVDPTSDAAHCGGCGRSCGTVCVSGACEPGCQVRDYGGHRYMFCTRYVQRDVARGLCRAWGGDLVSVDSAAEQAWLNTNAASIDVNAMWWIGVNDLATECGTNADCATWVNAAGAPLTYRNFCPGEPSDLHRNECSPDTGEDCVHMRWFPYRSGSPSEGCWNDIPCNCPSDGRTGLATYVLCER